MTTPDHDRLTWRKSTYSANQTDCVELAWPAAGALFRDSKNPHVVMAVEPVTVTALITSVKGPMPSCG
ncbi:uncharacterized protein DUF397 [Herbihabitans rhizosphaerae]|uniref:Uncharacterized protein DUF397 n=1 Tax=Herbihabitans rhizosphaerae TaxID=1872711 RepID=A0A4Q7KID4_9PSEU|nr:DUF397 domain-containing protein [Herbihabitans rhizosphaerae]RZS33965.1 uncharacterized protein DUF397 [Herbihabitans rhizosphaerae]